MFGMEPGLAARRSHLALVRQWHLSVRSIFFHVRLVLAPIWFLCASPAHATELYQHILAEVAEARVSGQVLLTGEFTARTAHLSDRLDGRSCRPAFRRQTSLMCLSMQHLCASLVTQWSMTFVLLQLCQGANDVFRWLYLRISPFMLMLEAASSTTPLHQQAFAVVHVISSSPRHDTILRSSSRCFANRHAHGCFHILHSKFSGTQAQL